jgi:hypothetical protein
MIATKTEDPMHVHPIIYTPAAWCRGSTKEIRMSNDVILTGVNPDGDARLIADVQAARPVPTMSVTDLLCDVSAANARGEIYLQICDMLGTAHAAAVVKADAAFARTQSDPTSIAAQAICTKARSYRDGLSDAWGLALDAWHAYNTKRAADLAARK